MTTATTSPPFARAPVSATARVHARRGRGTAVWSLLLAATLAFKSFVPLLAAWSADLQGKAVADVCAIYGVRLALASAHAPATSHAMHHGHGATEAAMHDRSGEAPLHPDHAPADHAEHARDHCALSGLAVAAAFAPAPGLVADWPATSRIAVGIADVVAPSRDASARWLAWRVHAPPARA